MNVVLVQEVARYNRLLEVVHASLEALLLALEGLVVTTAETEATLGSLLSNQVPARWQQRAYPSLKPLNAWIED
jgi:dynein heavy chain